jgi:hypothetical protein
MKQPELVLVDSETVVSAAREVIGCQGCSPEANVPFDWLLDVMTGRAPLTADYLMETPASCAYCGRKINEKTLIEPIC